MQNRMPGVGELLSLFFFLFWSLFTIFVFAHILSNFKVGRNKNLTCEYNWITNKRDRKHNSFPLPSIHHGGTDKKKVSNENRRKHV